MSTVKMDLSTGGRSVAENVELARIGEAAGWGGAWVSELNGADGVTTAAAMACAMSTGRLGSAILPMQTRNPLLLAMTAASLDSIAPGGFVLGLGTSTKLIIEGWHATPWGTSPMGLTRECVTLVRQFLAGERVTTESGRWQYQRAQLGIDPAPHLPIYLAALNDRMLELAGEIADGVILNFVTEADVRHARERVAAGAARAGRSLDDFEIMVYFRATETDDYERVRDRYQRELFTYVMAPVYQVMFEREGYRDKCLEIGELWRAGERAQALDAIPPALIHERTLVGSEAQIRSRLEGYVDAGMTSGMVLPVPIPDADYLPDVIRNIEALAPGN